MKNKITFKEGWKLYIDSWKSILAPYFKKTSVRTYKKTWKLLLPLGMFFLLPNFLFVPLTLTGTQTILSCLWVFTSLTIGWWIFYLFLWFTLTKMGALHKPDPNYKKAYNTVRSDNIRMRKLMTYLMRNAELRKQQSRLYSNFIRQLIIDGKISAEEVAVVFKTRKEAIKNTPHLKNIK
jgi:hypothetical protein